MTAEATKEVGFGMVGRMIATCFRIWLTRVSHVQISIPQDTALLTKHYQGEIALQLRPGLCRGLDDLFWLIVLNKQEQFGPYGALIFLFPPVHLLSPASVQGFFSTHLNAMSCLGSPQSLSRKKPGPRLVGSIEWVSGARK